MRYYIYFLITLMFISNGVFIFLSHNYAIAYQNEKARYRLKEIVEGINQFISSKITANGQNVSDIIKMQGSIRSLGLHALSFVKVAYIADNKGLPLVGIIREDNAKNSILYSIDVIQVKKIEGENGELKETKANHVYMSNNKDDLLKYGNLSDIKTTYATSYKPASPDDIQKETNIFNMASKVSSPIKFSDVNQGSNFSGSVVLIPDLMHAWEFHKLYYAKNFSLIIATNLLILVLLGISIGLRGARPRNATGVS